jgi:rod shape-determining protein MreC
MESFYSRYRNALVLIAVLLAQVIGLAVQVRRPGQAPGDKGGVRLIRAWVVGAVSPPERLLHGGGLGIRGIWTDYFDLIHVRQQNKNLQSQLDQLRLEEASLAEDARQGQRLQTLLGFQEKYIYKTVAAQVIGASGTEESHVLFIDKGSSDGLASDMPVITPDGIVGKTRDVFEHASQVLEISDPTSGAGVILQQTRIQGVMRGNSWGQPQIVNISPDDRIKQGEPVLTSGGDSIYPRGLAVGTVDRVTPDPEGTLVNVLVKPSANLSKLEEVLVITSTGSQVPSQMGQDLTDAQQKASEILAERLPSREDPNAPVTTGPSASGSQTQAPVNPNAPPPPPPKPIPPLHADEYSPSSVPPAADLVPGQKLSKAEVQPTGNAPGARETPSANGTGTGTAAPGSAKKSTGTDGVAKSTATPKSKPQPGSATASPDAGNPSAATTASPAEKRSQDGPPASPQPQTTTPQERN